MSPLTPRYTLPAMSWLNDSVILEAEGVEFEPFCAIGIEPKATLANRREIVPLGQPAVVIGRGSIIGPHAAIYWDVRIGRDCRFGDHVNVREGVTIGDRCAIGTKVDIQYGVHIADDVRILNETQIAGGSTIGRGTFIGPGVQTANDRGVNPRDYRDNGQVGVTIGEHVMIGVGAILLPGVKIGDGATVAAGALVTKDVGAGETVFGSPARVIYRKPVGIIEASGLRRGDWPAEQCTAGALSAGMPDAA